MRILLITTDIDHIEPLQYIGVQKKGAEVFVICEKGTDNIDLFREAGILVESIDFSGRRDRKTINTIAKKIASYNPDIVHVLRKKALSNTIPALKNCSAKLVVYRGIVGNLSFFDPLSWMTFLNPRVDRIICVAEAIRAHFIEMKLGPIKLNPDKIITIHKGHPPKKYQCIDKYDLTSFGIPENDLVIACTASMRPRKGVDVLVNAFSRIEKSNISLLLVGDIRDDKINTAINQSALKHKIFSIGRVSQSDALSIAGSVDVITMPSTKREGLPRALIEAMAQGVPAVVTDIGGSPELVENGVCGFVVPPLDVASFAEALNNITKDEDVLRLMGEAAQLRVATHFNVETTIEKNWQLYNELLADK